MRIIFYDSKSYDKQSFDKALRYFSDISIEYMVADLDARTAVYSNGYDAVCAFVNSVIDADVLKILYDNGIRLVLMRCAGFNNVDVNEADRLGITVMRVPGYSPEAVAELAMGLALAAQRRIHKAYIKVRENNFSLQGLTRCNTSWEKLRGNCRNWQDWCGYVPYMQGLWNEGYCI